MRSPRARPLGRWIGVSLVVAALNLTGCAPPPSKVRVRQFQHEPTVRVGLAVGVSDLILRLRGPAALHCCPRGDGVLEGGQTLRLVALEDAVVLFTEDGHEHQARERVILDPATDSSHVLHGEDGYRGRMEIRRKNGKLTLINEIGLEEYLRGVVPWEIGWHDRSKQEAVEAQAIAARTYACKRLGQYPEEGFDLYADVTDQVYRGTTRQDSIADRALHATRGMILVMGELLAEAYYSSTCGGHTSRIEEVWEKPPEPYLRGCRDAPASGGGAYCASSRHFRWTEAWSGAEIEAILHETLPKTMGPDLTVRGEWGLLDLQVRGRDSSGRVRTLEVQTTQGVQRVHGDRIRWVLRPRERAILRSILFDLEIVRESGRLVKLIVRGGGNGHGVGMCQMGALEMARRGYARETILSHYYPGTEIRQVYGED